MSTRILVLVLLLMALGTPPASAHRPISPRYAITVAMDYWAKRGVYMPCDVQVVHLTERPEWASTAYAEWNIVTCSIYVRPATVRDRFAESPFDYCYAIQYSMGYIALAGDLAERIRSVPWACDPETKVRRRFLRRWEARWGAH